MKKKHYRDLYEIYTDVGELQERHYIVYLEIRHLYEDIKELMQEIERKIVENGKREEVRSIHERMHKRAKSNRSR